MWLENPAPWLFSIVEPDSRRGVWGVELDSWEMERFIELNTGFSSHVSLLEGKRINIPLLSHYYPIIVHINHTQ